MVGLGIGNGCESGGRLPDKRALTRPLSSASFSPTPAASRRRIGIEMELLPNVRVNIVETSLVKPAISSPQPSITLSSIDLILRDCQYFRKLLFYQLPESCAHNDDAYLRCISALQSSLSQALVFFYPFAGRLVETDSGQLIVACNDKGAEFVQARIHGVSFAHLQHSNFDMQPCYVELTRWDAYSRRLEGSAPLLSIQVTRFSCGNIVLGIAYSHVIADGFSLWHFMNSWAECARGQPLSLYPSHDRTQLIVQNPATLPMIEFFEDIYKSEQKCQGIISKQRVFSFSRKMVGRLKERVCNEFGSYEVLCAHIWKKVSSARGHARNVMIGFGNVVNMRGRVDPPLASGYFGNVLLWGIASTTMGELEDEDLAATASRIRAAVSSCTNQRMEQMLKFLQLNGEREILCKILVNEVRLRVASSPKFPVMDTDFGWGAPLAVRSAVLEEDGRVVLYPGPSGMGSADLCISLPAPAMERLETDLSFLFP